MQWLYIAIDKKANMPVSGKVNRNFVCIKVFLQHRVQWHRQ